MNSKIFIFSNAKGGGDGVCYAMAASGHVLANHFCSSEAWAQYDLKRPDCLAAYAKHYPDGYELEFVPSTAIETHEELAAAYLLNQELR